jgi:cytochrome c556
MTETAAQSEFKINTKEVWRDLQQFRQETRDESAQVRRLLASIDNKLDVVSINVAHASKAVDDHEHRIRAIEKHVWRAAGIAAFLGASAGVIASLVSN